jgi:hypothetical protein
VTSAQLARRPSATRKSTAATATWDNRARLVTETLDAALKARLRVVLESRPMTETELRNLLEEGASCVLILEGRLRGIEQRLTDLSADPTSSLADIATEVRAANELRPDLDELRALLAELSTLARRSRASWLSTGA